MKLILFIVLALALIGGGIGFYFYNKPVESLAKKKVEVTITADQLVADYTSDEQAADQKYRDKIIAVSGRIASVTEEEGSQKVNFETSNPMSSVSCEMENKMHATNAKNGDNITIKGMCIGYLGDVQLVQSSIVK